MEYREIGKTGCKVSPLGFGMMRLPLKEGGQAGNAMSIEEVDVEKTIEMVHYAIDHGINYIDTAFNYVGGNSEKIVGQALASGAEVRPFTVNTAFQYAFEADDACLAADQLGSETNLLTLDIFAHPEVTANPPDRCYHCKKVIFTTIKEAAAREGIEVLIDGTNASDDPARRPGFRAIEELGVHSPLREAGLTKDAIRNLSRKMGLVTADKPNYSCLATRVEANCPITPELLASFVQEDWRERETSV